MGSSRRRGCVGGAVCSGGAGEGLESDLHTSEKLIWKKNTFSFTHVSFP